MNFYLRREPYYGHVLMNENNQVAAGFSEEHDDDYPYPVLTKADALAEFVSLGIEVGR